MLILINNIWLSLLLLALIVAYFWLNNNRYGKPLSLKACQRLATNENELYSIIDIRTNRKKEAISLIKKNDLEAVVNQINSNRNLIIIHDSSVTIAKFFRFYNLPTFHKHIYQVNLAEEKLLNINKYCQ